MKRTARRPVWLLAAVCAFGSTGIVRASEQSPAAQVGGERAEAEASKVSVSLDTLTLLSGKKGDIEVLQLIRVFNPAGAPYLGEPPEGSPQGAPRVVFRVPIPEGAFDIAPSDLANPQKMTEGPAGIFTTAPLEPGETLISFIYRVRPSRTGWALRREIDYPTRSINLLLGPGLTLQSAPGFKLSERKKLGAVEYLRYRAGPFLPGSVLTADVGYKGSSNTVWAGFAWAAAVAASVGLGLTMHFRRRRSTTETAAVNHPTSGDLREDLVLQIARLDIEFDSGSMTEEAYRSKRRSLKEKLEALGESVKHPL